MKVYVVGGSTNYADWMKCQLVGSIEEADVVLITGGADINPKLYNDEVGRFTSFTESRDVREVAAVERAKELNKVIWGTCRGIQLLCAMAGGKLIQHMSHPNSHKLTFYDGSTCYTTSCHHQMQYPYALEEGKDYYILANSLGLSHTYLNGKNEEMEMPNRTAEGIILEPELVYYPKLKAIGTQGHPEWMHDDERLPILSRAFLSLIMQDKLCDALDLSLPTNEIVARQDNFILSEDEQQLLIAIRKQNDITETVVTKGQRRSPNRLLTC